MNSISPDYFSDVHYFENQNLVKLIDIIKLNPSRRLKKFKNDELVSYVGLPETNDKKIHTILKRSYSEVRGRNIIQNDDVLFARIEPSIFNQKYIYADNLNEPAFTSTEFYVLEANQAKILPKYLFSLFFTDFLYEQFVGKTTGSTGRRRLDRQVFENLQIPLPSLSVQSELVEMMDTAYNLKKSKELEAKQILDSIDDYVMIELGIEDLLPDSVRTPQREEFIEVQNIPLSRGGSEAGRVAFESLIEENFNKQRINGGLLSPWQTASLFPYWNLPKNKALDPQARALRKAGVLSEVLFWQTFKDKIALGWDIDRQIIIGDFIVDFFIPELGLIFEIDGESHDSKGQYDVNRETFLKKFGLEVIHIDDIMPKKAMNSVIELVHNSIKKRKEFLESKTPPRQPAVATPPEGNRELGKFSSMRSTDIVGEVKTGESNQISPRQPAVATPPEGNFERKTFAVKVGQIFSGRIDVEFNIATKKQKNFVDFSSIIKSISGGATPKKENPANYSDKENGIPLFRIQNITDEEVELNDLMYISKSAHESLNRSKLENGDLLMTITGRVGTAQIFEHDFEANINQHSVKIKIDTQKANPKFIQHFWNSKLGREISNRSVTGTTRIALNYENLKSLQIPLPPLDIQNRIATEVTSRRARAKELQLEAKQILEIAKRQFEKMVLS